MARPEQIGIDIAMPVVAKSSGPRTLTKNAEEFLEYSIDSVRTSNKAKTREAFIKAINHAGGKVSMDFKPKRSTDTGMAERVDKVKTFKIVMVNNLKFRMPRKTIKKGLSFDAAEKLRRSMYKKNGMDPDKQSIQGDVDFYVIDETKTTPTDLKEAAKDSTDLLERMNREEEDA